MKNTIALVLIMSTFNCFGQDLTYEKAKDSIRRARMALTMESDDKNKISTRHRAKALKFLHEAAREINLALEKTGK